MTSATWIHWLKFNAVGGMGIGVQLITLTGLKSGLHIDYLLATALAVEAAVVHNFICTSTSLGRNGVRKMSGYGFLNSI